MKKLFFIAAIAGAALVSCTKNELAPSATEQHEITFASPVAQNVTKAELIPAIYPGDENHSFAVFADHHFKTYSSTDVTFTPYMRGTDAEGVKVSYTTGNIPHPDPKDETDKAFDKYWKPVSTYYWPMDGYLSFAAYSPDGARNNYEITYNTTNGIVISKYTTPAKGSQFDLMLSNRATDQRRITMDSNWSNTQYDGVNIQFKHVLSAINFVVKTDEGTTKDYGAAGYTITLNSLTVKNAYETGTLTQFEDNATVVDLSKVWSNVTKENEGYLVSTRDVVLTSKNVKATAQWANGQANQADLILLPQSLKHTGTGEKNVVVEIIYTVHHDDMGTTGIQYKKELPLAVGDISAWVPSTKYLYTIIIGMEEIVFAPTIVTDWATPVVDEDITL